jgi:predicted phosphodiesterase
METISLRDVRRVALLYDVHGNATALEAVLDDVEARGVDDVVLGGDYALKGPRPGRALELVRALEARAIRGNTDLYLRDDDSDDEVVRWTRDRLTADPLDWLADRPFACRIAPEPDADPSQHLHVVHATPTDLEDVLLVEPHPFDGWPTTDIDDARAMLGDVEADLVAYGHIHVATSGTIAGQRVRSIGSVGMPWDGDRRAAYAIARWQEDHWGIEDVRVEYDWRSVVERLESSDAPRARARAESIRTARFDPLAEST